MLRSRWRLQPQLADGVLVESRGHPDVPPEHLHGAVTGWAAKERSEAPAAAAEVAKPARRE